MKTENHIRNIYKNLSIKDYYQNHDYFNPHFGNIEYLINEFKNIKTFDNKNVLDLCCGNGEISNLFPESFVTGCDPYTFEKYKLKTNNDCLNKSFLDIVKNGLDKEYDFIICSYGLHLCDNSLKSNLLYTLSQYAKNLIVITSNDNCIKNINWWNLIHFSEFNRTKLFYFTTKNI